MTPSSIHSTATTSASLHSMMHSLHSPSSMSGGVYSLQHSVNASLSASNAASASPFASAAVPHSFAMLGGRSSAAAGGGSAFGSTGAASAPGESGSGEDGEAIGGAGSGGGWGEQFHSATHLKGSAGLWGAGPFTGTQSGGW